MTDEEQDLWIDTALAVQRGEPNSDVFTNYVESIAVRLNDMLGSGTKGTLVNEVATMIEELRRHVTVLRGIYPVIETLEGGRDTNMTHFNEETDAEPQDVVPDGGDAHEHQLAKQVETAQPLDSEARSDVDDDIIGTDETEVSQ